LALNAFVGDVYGERRIVKAGLVPEALVLSAKGYLPQCQGVVPPRGIYCHVVGTDLVRDRDGQMYVLEDNLRCPSGVSYVLENRRLMKRVFPGVLSASKVLPVDEYPSRLLATLRHLSPSSSPTVALLTPGAYNSAYFEHTFLAQHDGHRARRAGATSFVHQGDDVCMRTTRGYERVHVLYRRIDDDVPRPGGVPAKTACSACPGSSEVYKAGKCGDRERARQWRSPTTKRCTCIVPEMIKLLSRRGPGLAERAHVRRATCDERPGVRARDHLAEMVVKAGQRVGRLRHA
jgi:uncharacterized circularly permuted ATP-grasp superfamily protein